MWNIITGGTELPRRSHCCAYDPFSTKSSGNAQILFSSSIVNLRFCVGWTTEAAEATPPMAVIDGEGCSSPGLTRLK
jgi:hypothetical protein